MNELNINVKVSVGVTPALEGLLTRLLAPRAAASLPALPAAEPEQAQEPEKPQEPEKSEPQEPQEPEKAEPQEPEKPEYNDVYIRNAIDRTRMRIEGENYKMETTSERYKKYHKALTGEFKRIAFSLAASLGQEALEKVTERDPKGEEIVKPTRLPEIGLAEAFSRSCDELYVDENGELAVKAPY